jgi:RNA polymerase sigma-70 factor (ECF subfamily)
MRDTAQFEGFVRDYQDMVFSTAMRLLANETEAEDIAQEVFLKAYARWEELRHSPTIGGWLKTVATNLSLNHLSRYRARWRFFSDLQGSRESEEDDRPVEFAAPESFDRDLDNSDARALIEAALQKLPPAQRVAIVLYHMDGLSYEEIAAQLKVSLGKVKTDIFRGRAALRKQLENKLRPEET